MSLTKEDVKKVAKLAKLRLSEEEVAKFQGQLSSVLEYFDMLGEVDTTNVVPTAQTTGLINNFRVDEVGVSLPQDVAISQAEKTKDGYFKVKAVL